MVRIFGELILLWGDGSLDCILLATPVLLPRSSPESVVLSRFGGLLQLYLGLL